MVRLKYILPFLILFCGLSKVFGQYNTDKRPIEEHMRYSGEKKFNRWDIMVGYGPNILNTDFTDYLILPDDKWLFSPMIALSYQLVPALALDLRFMKSDLWDKGVSYYFDGDFNQFTGQARFYINQMLAKPGPLNDKWNFYVKAGFGFHLFRSRIYENSNNSIVVSDDIQPLGYDEDDPNKKTNRVKELVVPIGIGALYRLNRSFDIGIESTINYGFEDNLDGILLGATNDTYWHTTFNLSYKIGKKDKRHSKWTYRTYGFNIFGKKRKDPLEDEINQFERLLQQHEGMLRLQIDSVVTEENDLKVYEAENTFPIYFMPGGETFKDYENQITMAQIAVLLKKHPDWKLEIAGFATENENNPMFLSEQRAKTVKTYMTEHYGITEDIIKVTAKGNRERLTVGSDDKSEGMINIDRRVDIIIIKPDLLENKKNRESVIF